MRNRIRYTWYWLMTGRPKPYGQVIIIEATRRDKKKFRKHNSMRFRG